MTLRKGALAAGLQGPGILARGDVTHEIGAAWLHLQLEVVANSNGDVVINVRQSLATPTAPVWTSVPGIVQFVDDCTAVRTGSRPLSGGFVGHAGVFRAANAWAQHDFIEAARQP